MQKTNFQFFTRPLCSTALLFATVGFSSACDLEASLEEDLQSIQSQVSDSESDEELDNMFRQSDEDIEDGLGDHYGESLECGNEYENCADDGQSCGNQLDQCVPETPELAEDEVDIELEVIEIDDSDDFELEDEEDKELGKEERLKRKKARIKRNKKRLRRAIRRLLHKPVVQECVAQAKTCVEETDDRKACGQELQACIKEGITERFDEVCEQVLEHCETSDAPEEVCARIEARCEEGPNFERWAKRWKEKREAAREKPNHEDGSDEAPPEAKPEEKPSRPEGE